MQISNTERKHPTPNSKTCRDFAPLVSAADKDLFIERKLSYLSHTKFHTRQYNMVMTDDVQRKKFHKHFEKES